MNGKARVLSLKILTWLLLTITMVIIHISPKAAIQSQILYLPFVIRSNCTTNVVINGDFEQDDHAWSISSTGTGWKLHDLIGSVSEGFSPYRGRMLPGWVGMKEYGILSRKRLPSRPMGASLIGGRWVHTKTCPTMTTLQSI